MTHLLQLDKAREGVWQGAQAVVLHQQRLQVEEEAEAAGQLLQLVVAQVQVPQVGQTQWQLRGQLWGQNPCGRAKMSFRFNLIFTDNKAFLNLNLNLKGRTGVIKVIQSTFKVGFFPFPPLLPFCRKTPLTELNTPQPCRWCGYLYTYMYDTVNE